MASQSSDPPASDDTTGAAGDDKEPARIRSLDERFKTIEDKQDRQQSTLERILDALPGASSSGDGDDQDAGDEAESAPARRGGIGAEVRRQIEEADRRRAAEEKDRAGETWRQSVEAQLEELKAEKAPREPQTGIKGRLQRAMFGRPE